MEEKSNSSKRVSFNKNTKDELHPISAPEVRTEENKLESFNLPQGVTDHLNTQCTLKKRKSKVNNNKPTKGLNKRIDVVNKTFIRSIKRFYDYVCLTEGRVKSSKNFVRIKQT